MNWFLLLLILKLFTTNWSAPIDLVENREEFQQDLDNLINKGFSVADEANNLLHTSEALVNGTVNAFNSSTVNESLNENLHKVEEDLHKFSSELQNELQKDSTQDAIEVSFQQKPIEEEVSAQVTEISSFDGAAKNEGIPVEISTENTGEILANTESRTNSLNLAETSAAAQDLNAVKVESSDSLANQSQYSIDSPQQESSSTEQQSFQYPSSTSIYNAQEVSVPEINEEKAEEVSSTITSTEHQNEQLPHSSTEDITQQTSTEGIPSNEHSEHAKDSSDLKETVDTLANDLLNIASMVQTSTESSNAGEANENLNVSETVTEEHSERTPSFREAVDSFIEDIVEFGNKLGLAPEQTSEQPSIANQDSQNVEEVQTTSANPIESSTEQHGQNTEYPLPNTNNDDSQQITPEVQTISDAVESSSVTTASEETNGEESSTETPALKETVDSFINQVANIGSSLGETAKEIIDNAAMIKPEADNSSNSVLNIETSNNLEHSESQNPEETHEKVPTFKDAVDAFIEDVVEIGSKLGLVPEEKPAEGAVPETTEQENKTAESTAASDLNVSNSNVEETTDKAEEITPTTLSPMDSLNENQQENIPKADENTEYSNFGRSTDTLIQAASEIGNNFSEAVSNLFSLSDNPQETVTEIPNEISTEIATPEEQNKTNDHQTDSEASSTVSPIENNVEISSTTESPQTLENKQETENVHVPEAENFNDQIVKESPEEAKPKEEVKSAQFVEYIPVAVTTIPEEELQSERSAIAPQNETDQLNAETKSVGEEHQVNNETKTAEDEVTANAANKTAQEEDHESQSTSESQQPEEITTTPSATEAETSTTESPKTEEPTTSSPIAPETTTQAHTAVIEETTNAFNKFKNTLKTLIEQEKLKQQEKHLSTLETSHQETTTLAPNSQTFTTAKEESNTLVPQDETTMLPKKFEEELQMAVKALEETTHHHFEEFQNNLKEAFKKFTVWGAEHERQGEATTNKNNIEDTTQNSTEQPSTTIKTEEDSASTTEKVVETPLTEEEEGPHRIGAINQNFVDRFSDNYQENTPMSATEEQKKEEESTLASEAEREQTTEITFTLTTTMSPVEDEEDGKGIQEEQGVGATDSTEHSTVENTDEENLTPTAESIVKSDTEEAAETTESIPETTIMPLLARVPLHKDITSISLTTDEESATETLTHNEAATQPLETEQLKETHTELTQTQTAQPTEREQETITLSSPASYPQEMVTFIEHHEDTTTVRQADDKEEETTKEIEEENTAKSQTQEPLTQAAFMEEQQQQIESTTEHEAQTQTAAASGQTTATTANIEEDSVTTQEQLAEQQTTETEIYSTTVVEKEEDETTNAAITSTAAAVEPEPRSLSLPPPKLEYLQNEDGVEIFYGYSIVKHN